MWFQNGQAPQYPGGQEVMLVVDSSGLMGHHVASSPGRKRIAHSDLPMHESPAKRACASPYDRPYGSRVQQAMGSVSGVPSVPVVAHGIPLMMEQGHHSMHIRANAASNFLCIGICNPVSSPQLS
jgi:hypothetical protein